MTKIQNIGQIAIPVKDLESAIIFYRDTLGLEFLFQAPPGLAFFLCGEVRLMLEESPKEKADQYSSVIYFNVADIQSAFRELSTKGVDIVNEPHMIAKMPDHELWMVFFHDPSENLLALMSEAPLKE
jgi:methylmalonyl-CoA/ethylmalonyl-CoA epimerase